MSTKFEKESYKYLPYIFLISPKPTFVPMNPQISSNYSTAHHPISGGLSFTNWEPLLQANYPLILYASPVKLASSLYLESFRDWKLTIRKGVSFSVRYSDYWTIRLHDLDLKFLLLT